jgi:tetratricopeptide (TPR) repeat protein
VWVQDPFVLYRSYLWAIGLPALVFVLVYGTSPRALLVVGTIVGVLFTWQAIERVLSLSTPETAWTDAIRKLSKDPRAVGRWFPYLNRGSYYAERDQYALAIRDFETSAQLGDLGIGAYNAGAMFAATNKPQQALQMFDAAEKQGYNVYNLWFQRGMVLAGLGRPGEGYSQLYKALTAKPPPPPAARQVIILQLGRTGLMIGRPEETIRWETQLLANDPRHAEARYLLALAYVAKHEFAKALEAIEGAQSAASARGPAHYARALAYQGLGRKADALREIDAAVGLSPGNPAWRELQSRIRAMP